MAKAALRLANAKTNLWLWTFAGTAPQDDEEEESTTFRRFLPLDVVLG